MRFRTGILLLFTSLFCLCFGEQILLASVGSVVRLYLKMAKQVTFSYEALSFKEGGLVFYDLTLKDQNAFSFEAPKTILSFRKKHIEVDRPRVILSEIPSWLQGSKESQWTFALTEGVLSGEKIQQVEFALSKESTEKPAFLQLHWDQSELDIAFTSNHEAKEMDIHCVHVPLSFLHPWIGDEFAGVIDGSFHLTHKGDRWIAASGAIHGHELSYQGVCEKMTGQLIWEGPLELAGDSFHWEPMYRQGRLRFDLFEGKILSPEGRYAKEFCFCGALSFNGLSGAKWEFSLTHDQHKIQSMGRGFFQSIQSTWVESELQCEDTLLVLKGSQKDAAFQWNLEVNQLQAHVISLLQDALLATGYPKGDFFFQKGVLDGEAQFSYENKEFHDFQILKGSLAHLLIEKDCFLFGCEKAYLKGPAYQFENVSLHLPDHASLHHFSGSGNIEKETASMVGVLEEHQIACTVEGSPSSFLAKGTMEGLVNGTFLLKAGIEPSRLHFQLLNADLKLFSKLQLTNLSTMGEVDALGVHCYDTKGVCQLGKKISFYCPIFESNGKIDFRLQREFFDVARFVGQAEAGQIHLDVERSHIFNEPILNSSIALSEKQLDHLQVHCTIPLQMMPYLFDMPKPLQTLEGFAKCQFSFEKDKEASLEMQGECFIEHQRIEFDTEMIQEGLSWRIHPSKVGKGLVEGLLSANQEGLSLTEGKLLWEDGVLVDFVGQFEAMDLWQLKLSRLSVALDALGEQVLMPLKGKINGEGLIHYDGSFEFDLDLVTSDIQIKDWIFENQGPLQVYRSSKSGILVRGVHASIFEAATLSLIADCKVNFLQYDPIQSFFQCTQSELNLSPDFLRQCVKDKKIQLPEELLPHSTLHLLADIGVSSDLSHVFCTLNDVLIPLKLGTQHIQNGRFEIEDQDSRFSCELDMQNRWIPLECAIFSEKTPHGKLIIDQGLRIDWTYEDAFTIQTIEGQGIGIDATFRMDGESLVGSAHCNGHELKQVMPQEMSDVLDRFKIGKGYELMGRIYLKDQIPSFKGLLSGKQIELLGFQLKNLLGKIELSPEKVQISDMKISDFAGTMKIDQLLVEKTEGENWTISMPLLSAADLRPSLLHEVDMGPGELNPLLIKKLNIRNFRGTLNDRTTYTAEGELDFINSYKREKTIFDIPSDVLSRIIGLDLDLLVPVCGTLRYELYNGLVHFTELEGSYSENKRSEFFLVYGEESPTMDLDWNLNLLIKMKYFVLFTFAEPFVISVKGKLDAPKFNLQSKKKILTDL